MFIVWLLTGIWHGANWTFISWGLFYFVLLVIEKQTGLDKKKTWWGHIYTMFFVILAWVLFRANSISFASQYIKAMFGISVSSLYSEQIELHLYDSWKYIVLGLIFIFPFNSIEKLKNGKMWQQLTYSSLLLLLFLLTITFIVCDSYNPFIYFNF